MSQRRLGDQLPADESPVRRWRHKLVRQWQWARRDGFGRWIEEDQLNPVDRVRRARSKQMWRRHHGLPPGQAVPVFLVGVQRSGTNMLVRGLEAAPEVEVHNENDRKAFQGYRLRSDQVVADIIMRSRHRYVLFKPLCDSHRIDELLDSMPVKQPGRAIWAYRDVDGRVRSAVSRFGDVNLRVLSQLARGEGLGRWQAQRISPDNLALIAEFDYATMSAETAAALFWYIRNCLYFDLELDKRDDTFLSSYDHLVAAPEETMRSLCAFLGFPCDQSLTRHIQQRPNSLKPFLDIDQRVRALCDRLTERLDANARAQLERWSPH
jgi:hypothetical protein